MTHVCDYCDEPVCEEIDQDDCPCMACDNRSECNPSCGFAGTHNNPVKGVSSTC